MKKQELIELVEARLSAGDATADVKARFHGNILALHIAAIYNRLIFDTYVEGKTHQDFSQLDAFAKNFRAIDILDDADRGLKYSVLPFPPVRLPENLGIRMIIPEDDPTNPFAHVDNNSQAVLSTLDVGVVDTVPEFWIEKHDDNKYRVYYRNTAAITTVAILMLLPLTQYGDYDDVPMPSGRDLDVVDMIVERLGSMGPQDTNNDNTTG